MCDVNQYRFYNLVMEYFYRVYRDRGTYNGAVEGMVICVKNMGERSLDRGASEAGR